MTKQFRKAIVVGGTSGIGREIARQLAASGCKVAVAARRTELLESLHDEFPDQILAFVHDVEEYREAPELFLRITKELGGLDLLVYASGVMHPVEWTEFDTEKDMEMLAVNCAGAVSWINQAAIRFQGTKSGTIVGISSAAGERGRGSPPVYGASKFSAL